MKNYIFGAILFVFVVTGLNTAAVNGDMFQADQSIFTDLAYEFAGQPTWLKLVPPAHIATGAKTDTHPLAPYCFSFLTKDFPSFFPRGKLLNLLFGLIALISLGWVVSLHCGKAAALIATFCLATNVFFIQNCTKLSSEPLMLLFFILWLHYSCLCLLAENKSHKNWIVSGSCAGLAYLAKPQAILLPIVFLLAFIYERKRPQSATAVLAFYISFLLFASPLMWSRITEGRFPFYNANFNTVFSMTIDNYDDSTDIPKLDQRGIKGNLSHFFQTQNIVDYLCEIPTFCKRLVNRIFNRLLPGPIPGSVLLILFLCLFYYFARHGVSRSELAPFLVPFFVLYSLALLPVTRDNDSARFYLPLLVSFYFVLGSLCARFIEGHEERFEQMLLALVVIAFFALPIRMFLKGQWGNPLSATDSSIELSLAWLSKNAQNRTIFYPSQENWWLSKSALAAKKFELVEITRANASKKLKADGDGLLILSTSSFNYDFGKVGKEVYFVPAEAKLDDIKLQQCLPAKKSKIGLYQVSVHRQP